MASQQLKAQRRIPVILIKCWIKSNCCTCIMYSVQNRLTIDSRFNLCAYFWFLLPRFCRWKKLVLAKIKFNGILNMDFGIFRTPWLVLILNFQIIRKNQTHLVYKCECGEFRWKKKYLFLFRDFLFKMGWLLFVAFLVPSCRIFFFDNM